ncbi:MAG: RNA-splicing ligase RtcB [Candidatus Buchananbacteria bacterium RIFCSPHIGHO2_01_FULL_39_8]|uniref:tRNA-splicing ligase RtcB n=1 Tax=Candidatus Buchananbacteria bacterium RIFCSPHIGHO2_01_FULL_39_8 TaxID=1797533 RepID=A0A1G1XVL3_9BACT|nr:hypothetical protein [uncultured bacterium]OGY44113.1 MAG: RNA-splicing ligase RtcB [Candidatus Buchananbacteria bacterium RIFCSPHIGHO2_01_FULL_39_8]
MIEVKDLKKISDYLWEIPKDFRYNMKVPARFYATQTMLPQIFKDRSLNQLVNVTALPGINKYALAMPDIHEGYGFPIGGVAAIEAETGVISPGGVGYDINCGVRLLISQLFYEEIKDKLVDLTNQIQRDVPSGVGRGGMLRLNTKELNNVLKYGARWAVQKGYGTEDDLNYLEENGEFKIAEPTLVSDQAKKRGADQIGTLGAGNHFLEIQKVTEVFDLDIAKQFGVEKNKITVMIHTGSRGLGHQVCTDYVRLLDRAAVKYNIKIPDRELACVPFKSDEGQKYFKAMAAAANFAWCNRQLIMHRVRGAWQRILGKQQLQPIYDVAHNIAKLEKYDDKVYVVHRKGATRCFGPGQVELSEKYQQTGQPVIIPGSMGTASYLLSGTQKAMVETFGSTCHGAGRAMSRTQALKNLDYNKLKQHLEKEQGIILRAASTKGLLEEAPEAYKNIDEVVEVVYQSGIAKKIAKLKPLAVIKG